MYVIIIDGSGSGDLQVFGHNGYPFTTEVEAQIFAEHAGWPEESIYPMGDVVEYVTERDNG